MWYLLTPYLLLQLELCKTPQDTEEDAVDPEPAADGDTKMEYSPDSLCSPSIRTVTKKLHVRTYLMIQYLSGLVRISLTEFYSVSKSMELLRTVQRPVGVIVP